MGSDRELSKREGMLWLCGVKNMWHGKMKKLLHYFGSADKVFFASERELAESGCLKPEDVAEIIENRKVYDPAHVHTLLSQNRILFLTEEDEEYPKRLRKLEERPYILFVKGKTELLKELSMPAAAVIGARVCSHYGWYAAEKFAGELAVNGVTIVSGMARGIDSAAHKGALAKGGKTIAVLGCGVDICYPPENKELYKKIEKEGLLISEYYPGTKPFAWQFPKRNRIISGLSDAVLIAEAKEESGSLITARWALDQGIDVFAVPGRINDPLSRGCNQLIQDGAAPALDVSDILLNLGINYKILKKEKIFLEKENEVVYSVLGLYPQSMDEILRKTHLDAGEVHRILLKLQISGLVEEPVKNYYVRKN